MTDEKMTDNRALFYSQPLITVLAEIEDMDKSGDFQLGRAKAALDDDFPDYVTHWTRIAEPEEVGP